MMPTTLFEWSMSAMTWPEAEQQPGLMSDELLSEWFDLMNDPRLPDHVMEAEFADGYLTASYLSPDSPHFAEVLGAIFGQDELPLCEDTALQERVLKLTHHRWQDIQNRLGKPLPTPDEASKLFTPTWGDVEEGSLISPYKLDAKGQRQGDWAGKWWAQGFMQCAGEDPNWDYLFEDKDNIALFNPLLLLDMGYNPDKPELQIEDMEELQLYLIMCLYEIRSYWKKNSSAALAYSARLADEELSRLPYFRDTPKVGRNDPCPCGSGKKHKKCCGA
jgi:uncharacterized protein